MKIKVFTVLLLASFALSLSSSRAPLVLGVPENYEPGGLYVQYVTIEFWIAENGTAFVTVTLGFPSTQWFFESWGKLTRDDSDFYGDSYIWVGPDDLYYLFIYWEVVTDFNLGQLEEGVYTFTLTSWGKPVKSIVFEVGFPADINDDGKVDIKDIAIVALAFGSHNPDINWNPDADIYRDGKIDIRDIAFTASHFGEMAP